MNDTYREKPQKRLTSRIFKNQILAASDYTVVGFTIPLNYNLQSFIIECRCLKSGSGLPKKLFFISFNDSPSKMMKNAFFFILKALFVLKIFKFLF